MQLCVGKSCSDLQRFGSLLHLCSGLGALIPGKHSQQGREIMHSYVNETTRFQSCNWCRTLSTHPYLEGSMNFSFSYRGLYLSKVASFPCEQSTELVAYHVTFNFKFLYPSTNAHNLGGSNECGRQLRPNHPLQQKKLHLTCQHTFPGFAVGVFKLSPLCLVGGCSSSACTLALSRTRLL